jgi:hypothetical protein
MPKIVRKTQKIFAKDGEAIGQFGSAELGDPTLTNDLDLIQALPAYDNGWNDAVLNGLKRPPLEEFNALKYVNDYQNAYLLQEGIAEYDATTTYYKDSLVKESGTTNIYRSVVDDNIGISLSNPASWEFMSDLRSPINVVLVTKESDFGIRSRITIEGGSYAGMDELVFVFGAGDAFSTDGQAGTLHIFNLNITDATGISRFMNSTGDGSFTEQSIFVYIGTTLQNFGSFGDLTGFFTIVLRRFFCFETGKLTINNAAALTVNAFLWKNFTTKGQMFDMKTNISQAAFTEVSLLPAKGDEPLNVDPAIIAESGISITLFPYNGFVFVNAVDFADNGGGGTTVTTAIGHSFDNADFVFFLSGTYAGVQQISNVINKQADVTWGSVGKFDIPVAFAGNDLSRPLVYLFDIGLTERFRQPFYRSGNTGAIVSIFDNGGFARVNSIAHGNTTGQSLFIDTNNYEGGYYAVNFDVDNFDLLDPFGNPVPFTTVETGGTWDTSSLDQTNNVLSVQNTGGIIPDSQILGNNILSSTVAFPSTTTLTRLTTGTWIVDEKERFKPTPDGRLIYTGRTTATVSISAKAVAQKQGGSTSTAFMNIMEKRVGAGSFTEIVNHPSSQTLITSSDSAQLTIAAIVEKINPGDEFGIGIASDISFTMNIFSIDFNIKK